MSEERHTRDLENKLDHHTAGGTEGGKCLNRHESRKPNNSCSHIWQATKKAESDSGLYNWPRYKDMPGTLQVFFQGRVAETGKPQEGDWNVKPGNFDTHCDVPYFHEAHHVIPNSTLSTTLSDYLGDPKEGGSPELVMVVRGGLLTAGYNLNHMDNMIMLPLDATVAKVMRLPRHRTLPLMYHGVSSTRTSRASSSRCPSASTAPSRKREKMAWTRSTTWRRTDSSKPPPVEPGRRSLRRAVHEVFPAVDGW